jgi:hypothetical protein
MEGALQSHHSYLVPLGSRAALGRRAGEAAAGTNDCICIRRTTAGGTLLTRYHEHVMPPPTVYEASGTGNPAFFLFAFPRKWGGPKAGRG